MLPRKPHDNTNKPQHHRAPPPLALETDDGRDDAESKETLQALGILAAVSGSSVAIFFGLTALGVDDILAGNLLLVILAAATTYLLFFDGGATQAGLQAQAVQQVAYDEGMLMSAAPLDDFVAYAATDVASDAGPASAALRADGVTRVNGVLSEATARSLLATVEEELADARASVAAGQPEAERFGGVLVRANRFDLKLPLSAPVRGALLESLGALRQPIAAAVGEDADLFELAALISRPGAPPQPAHPDTPFFDDPTIVTGFVALQDVEAEMGPTFFLRGTHTRSAHARFNGEPDAKASLLRTSPRSLGLLRTGDVTLFDSRLVHGGGENTARQRVLFYFSFKASAGRRTADGTLLATLKKQHTLDSLSGLPV